VRQRLQTLLAGLRILLVFARLQAVQHLLDAFKAQKRAAQHQQRRNRPGNKALISKASGTRITLLTNEPLATPQTTGSSRLARTPVTCWALSERSSQHAGRFFRCQFPHHGNIVQ
jgi:hypothetical protein